MASATLQSLSKSREEQETNIAALKEQIQENRSRLLSFEELQKNYEGYQEGVRAIMLKKQRRSGAQRHLWPGRRSHRSAGKLRKGLDRRARATGFST